MKKTLLFLACLLTNTFLNAQIVFERTYPGTVFSAGNSVCQTNDNGYIIAGSKGISVGFNQIWLLKTNEFGDTLWTKTLYGTAPGAGYSVIQSSDGGYVVTGYIFNGGTGDVVLIKTSSEGTTLWAKTYGGADDDQGYSVAQTVDGGYVITGYKTISSANTDVYLIRTDTSGNTIWAKTFGGSGIDQGLSVIQTNDSGFIVSGMIMNPDSNFFYNVYAIKTNSHGDTLWTKKYGGSYYDAGQCIAKTNNNNYIISGATIGDGSEYSDVYLIKINDNGDTLWTKTFGSIKNDRGYSISSTNDNGYVIAGNTINSVSSYEDVYLTKLNSTGDTLWTRTFGGNYEDYGFCVRQANDGGYIITGLSFNDSTGMDELYLIKTDGYGSVAGIKETLTISNTKINLYPNPTTGQVKIQIPEQFLQTKTLELYDCMGQLQFMQTDRFSEADLSNLNSGLYFLVLTNFRGQRHIIKIMKE